MTQLDMFATSENVVTSWFEEDHLILCIERDFTPLNRKQFVSAVKANVGGIKSIEDDGSRCYSITFRRASDIQEVRQFITALAVRFVNGIEPEVKQTSLF